MDKINAKSKKRKVFHSLVGLATSAMTTKAELHLVCQWSFLFRNRTKQDTYFRNIMSSLLGWSRSNGRQWQENGLSDKSEGGREREGGGGEGATHDCTLSLIHASLDSQLGFLSVKNNSILWTASWIHAQKKYYVVHNELAYTMFSVSRAHAPTACVTLISRAWLVPVRRSIKGGMPPLLRSVTRFSASFAHSLNAPATLTRTWGKNMSKKTDELFHMHSSMCAALVFNHHCYFTCL